MAKSMAFLSLFLAVLNIVPTALAASSCVAFDINWNLLAFNLGGKDWNAGTKDTWASGSAKDITGNGRPPFDTNTVTCYLSQFGNAIYVAGADSKNLANIGIYDATANAWSTQTITAGSFDPSNMVAILDHDTDVFYAISNGELFSLTMDTLKTAKPEAIPWQDVQKPPFDASNPTMALASNHIHFLDVPGVAAGSADIFVIHFSFFQPASQAYGDFPASHGQTASIFLDEGVQAEFVFVPDDGSATYVINVLTNTTQKLASPPAKDAQATYFGAPDTIVQLSSTGSVAFLPYNANSTSANAAAAWSTVQNLASSAPPSSGSTSGSSSAAGPGASSAAGGSPASPVTSGGKTPTSPTGSTTGSSPSGSGAAPGAAGRVELAWGMTGALILSTLALLC